MRGDLLCLFKCIECKSEALSLNVYKEKNGSILVGDIECSCGKVYEIENGIPRFLEKWLSLSDTIKNFEFQWETWGKEEVIFGRTKEESRAYLLDHLGFGLDEKFFEGKMVLDAGCGHGRFVELFAEMGAELAVGIDLGDGIEIAKWRNRNFKNTLFVQGNLLNVPFRSEFFDYAWCNGVLHHTPNPRLGLQQLCEITKKKGYVNLWLYPKGGYAWEISQKAIRSITTRLNLKLLYILCYMAAPLLYVVPTYSSTNPRKNTWKHCAQVIFDWYSPKYQSHHTNEEVVEWFREEGFSQTDVLDLEVTVVGKK